MMRVVKHTFIFFSIGFIILFIGGYFHFFGQHLTLVKTSFKRLSGWEQDDQSKALLAFQNSCREINTRSSNTPFSLLPHSGNVKNWQTICAAAMKLNHPDQLSARRFFEAWFQPYTVGNYFNKAGLFTGYYLPMISGSLKKSPQYPIPVYGLPKDLVKINLHTFHSKSPQITLVGQVNNFEVRPYPDRAAIAQGINAPVILWSNNLIDTYFAQIQGSAIVNLPNHKQLLISYAGTNGRSYTPIGKILIQQKAIDRKNISMQTIREWLTQHPEQINTILNQDASYIFFNIASGHEAIGTEQVPLTPERSLAVDLRYLALGLPIWLDTQIPQSPSQQAAKYQHLLVAQDTGGAINGIVRGDVYWGAGENAAYIAGHMKSPGKYYILLPKL